MGMNESNEPLVESNQAIQALADCDRKIAILKQIVANRDGQFAIFKQNYLDLVTGLKQTLTVHDDQIQTIEQTLAEIHDELASIRFYLRRITAPLRLAKRLIQNVLHPLKAFRLSRDILIIRNSNLFDIGYYLSQYRDIRISACSPIRHYCELGWKERRNPTSSFDTNLYLLNNIDVAASGINPFVHYIKHGRIENSIRKPVLNEEKDLPPHDEVISYNKLNGDEAHPFKLFTEFCSSSPPIPLNCPAEGETVDLSVIVPVYNQWLYTYTCLNSIAATCLPGDIRYEVILADDNSTDDTINAEYNFPSLRVVQTPQNLGFLRNCNHAARYARGRHILFLNNDTVVLPGWMTSLHQLMEADESAAIIGSKLLYPNGTIQEAGAILWNDGSASNIGRGEPRNLSSYDYVREVDYVSGASFLVRKTFWESIGGFDEGYENAYCEDSDLSMTARAKGMRVLYQPKSEVIHFEHKSYTGERTDYLLPIQQKNINRLRDKWRYEFSTAHLSPGTSEYRGIANAERSASKGIYARRRLGNLNVLYFSPFPSHPSSHGNQSTIQQFGRRFQSMGHKVHFALLRSNHLSDDAIDDMRTCWDTLDILPNDHSLGANGEAILFDGWYEEGLGERIHSLCTKYDIDVVFCSYVFHSKLLEFVPSHMLKVIDTHDKMGNRYDMLRANGQPLEFFSCTPEEEGAYLRRADVVVARREEEAGYFNSVSGCATAIVIPHVEAPQFVDKTFNELGNVGIVASANRINLAIVRECLGAIDLRLHGKSCPFTVHVAGQVKDMVDCLPPGEAAIFYKPWVRLLGFVPDIAKFYADMDVIVSPVTMGTGINVKTVQAMAFGMPLLTTAWGAKGIESGDPLHSLHNLNDLVDSLLTLEKRPEELQRLAEVSRTRYISFYHESLSSIQSMFKHPKLFRKINEPAPT